MPDRQSVVAVPAALLAAALLTAPAAALTLAGSVVDAHGLPIPGARVRVYSPDLRDASRERGAVTGPDGKFEIEGVAEGVAVVECEDLRHEAWAETRTLDRRNSELRIVLRTPAESAVDRPAEGVPAVTVLARVEGEAGEPVENAVVVVGDLFEITDAAGRCEIPRVLSGRRRVKVVAGGFETFRGETLLEPGKRELSFRLRREAAFATVHGVVRVKRLPRDADMPPIKVLFGERVAVTDARGRFRIDGVRAGRVPVTLIHDRREIHAEIAEVRKGDFAFEVLLERLH